jgi:hypothetical protein
VWNYEISELYSTPVFIDIFQFEFELEGMSVCQDALGVHSPNAQWAEWLVAAPLLGDEINQQQQHPAYITTYLPLISLLSPSCLPPISLLSPSYLPLQPSNTLSLLCLRICHDLQ